VMRRAPQSPSQRKDARSPGAPTEASTDVGHSGRPRRPRYLTKTSLPVGYPPPVVVTWTWS
jgi:hypothetical protein